MKNTTLKMMMIVITGLFLASLNSVAHAEREYYKKSPQCVSWDRKTGSLLFIKNNCGFDIAVWFCDKKSKRHCGNSDYYKRFNHLFFVEPYGTETTGIPSKHGVRYLACGANGVSWTSWNIGGNIPNSNRFACYTGN